MSDNEEQKSEIREGDQEEQEEVEPEEPRTMITPQTIVEGLSMVQRTAGKYQIF